MYRLRFFVLICALIAFCEADHVFADSPSVTAVLSNSDVAVGEAVQLQIRVSGAGEAKPPENIAVDGLEVHRLERRGNLRCAISTSAQRNLQLYDPAVEIGHL